MRDCRMIIKDPEGSGLYSLSTEVQDVLKFECNPNPGFNHRELPPYRAMVDGFRNGQPRAGSDDDDSDYSDVKPKNLVDSNPDNNGKSD